MSNELKEQITEDFKNEMIEFIGENKKHIPFKILLENHKKEFNINEDTKENVELYKLNLKNFSLVKICPSRKIKKYIPPFQ